MDDIGPFRYDPQYPFVFCTVCRWAYIGDEVYSHMKTHHKERIKTSERKRIAERIRAIPRIICSQAELCHFPLPERTTKAIPYIATPASNGLRCKQCAYVVCTVRTMQEHCRAEHNWINDWKVGGHVRHKMKDNRDLPWESNIRCQKLFQSRAASGWFEVQGTHTGGSEEESHSTQQSIAIRGRNTTSSGGISVVHRHNVARLIENIIIAQEERFIQGSHTQRVAETDDKTDANAWLRRTGWSAHLDGLDVTELEEMQAPITENEIELQYMRNAQDRVLQTAYSICQGHRIGLAALFEINRREVTQRAKKPFETRMEDDSWQRYKGVMHKILYIVYRAESRERDSRPPYEMTAAQEQAWRAFKNHARQMTKRDDKQQRQQQREALREQSQKYRRQRRLEAAMIGSDIDSSSENDSDDSSSGSSSSSDDDDKNIIERIDGACLEFLMAMANHQLGDYHYDSVLLSALAVMGVRGDGGWESPLNYTPIYSAVVKVYRMAVLYRAYIKRQQEIREICDKQGVSLREAKAMGRTIFARVQADTRQFMTRIGNEPDQFPTPMDWILETRTYGLRIRYSTTAGALIDWIGNEIIFQQLRFSMTELSGMMHSMVADARAMMCQLTMTEEEGIGRLPSIPWSKLEDDNSNEVVGYSFLTDERNNEWTAAGDKYIFKQMIYGPDINEWIGAHQDCQQPFQESRVAAYGRLVDQFREKMLIMMHMISGQPARATEILTLRYKNTANGGARNIFASHGQMCFVTAYHKNFRQSNEIKIIHRFMPAEVGELLVWYLWLVLPFWQTVQGTVKQATATSAFIWASEMTTGKQQQQREKRDYEAADGEGNDEPTAKEQTMFKERKWTSDRVRRIIAAHSEHLLGQRIITSSWRHIAIGIANRYMGSEGVMDDDDGGGEEDEDEIDTVNRPQDEQAGHTTRIGGAIYARELQQGLGGTALMREKFRDVSQRWHRFFGFGQGAINQGGTQGEATARGWRKRRMCKYDEERQRVRLQRLQAIRQTDIGAALRSMKGPGAVLRAQQREAISAIVRGESTIVQITPTGGGKSMSFMLPAKGASSGRTIVVVPLVALQEDMQRECINAGIATDIWDSADPNPKGTIILVSPETIFSKTFQRFLQWMQNQYILDRVVVDECHTILDGSNQFRPALRDMGGEIQSWGVQRIFLTATLPPVDEEEFYRRAYITPADSKVIRGRTTRKNIRYRVAHVKDEEARPDDYDAQEAEEELTVAALVKTFLEFQKDELVIVYAGERDRVERIASRLRASAYHSKAGTRKEKREYMDVWIMQDRCIVATGALGLGINIPNVGLVIHVGVPRQMRLFVQESGRLGRDGRIGDSVIICKSIASPHTQPAANAASTGKTEKEKQDPAAYGRETTMLEYIRGDVCRRCILDKAMDGIEREGGCGADEEKCDVCNGLAGQLRDTIEAAEGADTTRAANRSAWDSEDDAELRRSIQHQRDTQEIAMWQRQSRVKRSTVEANAFRDQIASWSKRCIVCHIKGNESQHETEKNKCIDSRTGDWAKYQQERSKMQNWIKRQGSMAEYTACFQCGLPQWICQRWRTKDGDEGSYEQIASTKCQHGSMISTLISACIVIDRSKLEEITTEVSEREEMPDGKDWMQKIWGERRTNWGGYTTNNLNVVCCRMMAYYE